MALAGNDVIEISAHDLDLILASMKNEAGSMQHAREYGRAIMTYLFGTRPTEFWFKCVEDKQEKDRMAAIRHGIDSFVLAKTGFSVVSALENYGSDKRRCAKNIIKRARGEFTCENCHARFKDASDLKHHGGIRCPGVVQSSMSTNDRAKRTRRRAKQSSNKEYYKIINYSQKGLKVKIIQGKSRGVFAARVFHAKDFLCVYGGKLIEAKEVTALEAAYGAEGKGCYMYHFSNAGKNLCYDATKETDNAGRLINHSRERKSQNAKPKLVVLHNTPYIVFYATREIRIGEEILYDYGDRNRLVVQDNPWLNH